MSYPWPSSDVTCTDGFCGSGGSTDGIEAAGVRVMLAMNHNDNSLATHAQNFPHARHAKVDLSQEDPRRYPTSTIAWFSPECTNHSTSKGIPLRDQNQLTLWTDRDEDPFVERSRATMWDVVRWAEAKHFSLVFVENITKVPLWGGYHAWLKAMMDLDYCYKTVYFNSMFAPAFPRKIAQSRDRWYTVFWKRHNPAPDLDFTPPAFCQYCEKRVGAVQAWKNPTKARGDYKRQYVYRCPLCAREVIPAYAPAMSVINWTLPVSKIGERMSQKKRPLKEKTLRRIAMGLERFCTGQHLTPFLVETTRTMSDGAFARAVTDPHYTQTTAQSVGVTIPSFLLSYYGRSACYKTMNEAIGTITSKDRHALVQPGQAPTVEECGFRMLTLPEIKAAMGFSDNYHIICTSQKEGVRQCGLAVTPAVATMLVQRGLQSLGYQMPCEVER